MNYDKSLHHDRKKKSTLTAIDSESDMKSTAATHIHTKQKTFSWRILGHTFNKAEVLLEGNSWFDVCLKVRTF